MTNNIMNIVRNGFKLVLDVLILLSALLLFVFLYNFIYLTVMNKDFATYFGYAFFEVKTGSMEDTILINDYVFVKVGADVKENDIVTFYNDNGEVITHRIITIDGDKVITKGDNNDAYDDAITKEHIVGKVVHIGKQYGTYLRVMREPNVYILFFVTLVLFYIVLFDEKKEVIKDEKKEDEKVSE